MENLVTSSFRLGVVGGGQLGRMLALKAADWDIRTCFLDEKEDMPAHIFGDQFQIGSIRSYEDVVSFGRQVDVLTIESDHVNADALEYLESIGKKVFPNSKALRIIQDKGLQRQFCKDQGLAVPRFKKYLDKYALKENLTEDGWLYPFMVKTTKSGYDGRGVFKIESESDIDSLPNVEVVAEEKIDIQKELTMIGVRNAGGEIALYPVAELFMKQNAYLVDYLIGPTHLDPIICNEAERMTEHLLKALDIQGILAVEYFLDKKNRIWINECSPRPHNSGHHTIESSVTSQYEQHLRGIFNVPLGDCGSKSFAAMINLLGDENAEGPVRYEGLTDIMKLKGVKLHIYGKQTVKPYRKMGHVTVLSESCEDLKKMIQIVKDKVRVVA